MIEGRKPAPADVYQEVLHMFQSIGFIGTGNMGSALALAADKGAPQGAVLYLSNRTPAKAEALCAKLSRAPGVHQRGDCPHLRPDLSGASSPR